MTRQMSTYGHANTNVKYKRIDFVGSKDKQREALARYVDNVLRFNVATGRLAPLVYDIDDTLVDDNERVIAPIAALYRKYVNIIPTYIVTARPDVAGNREETCAMLKRNKLDGYKGIYLMPVDSTDAAHFKWRKRIDIGRRCGQHPQMSIGDQSWDAFAYPVPRDCRDLARPAHRGAVVQHASGRGEMGCLLPDS